VSQERTGRIAQRFNLLLQRRPVVEDDVGPFEDALAVPGQSVEALATLDDRHTELLLELTDSARERRLRHVTGLRGAGEVLLAGERHQILQLADVHLTFSVIRNADSAGAADRSVRGSDCIERTALHSLARIITISTGKNVIDQTGS
jgi:hypothetical protein